MGRWPWQVSLNTVGMRDPHTRPQGGLSPSSGSLSDGIPFFRSANGVILTPGNAQGLLAPKYFKEALQLRPTRENLLPLHPSPSSLQPVPPHLSLTQLPTLNPIPLPTV